MTGHRYAVGQTVGFLAPPLTEASGGAYRVVRQLPSDGAEFWYRIKSDREPFERAVSETQLQASPLPVSASGTAMRAPLSGEHADAGGNGRAAVRPGPSGMRRSLAP